MNLLCGIASLSYALRARIRSIYFLIIRVIIRDFNLRFSRSRMLRILGLENVEDIFFKRTSAFYITSFIVLNPLLWQELYSVSPILMKDTKEN